MAELIKLAGELLGVEATLIRSALLDVLETGEVVQGILGDKACIFLAGLHAAERMIAERLLRRTKGTPPWPEIDLARALPWVQEKTGKALSPSQSEAVRRVLGAKLAVITGGPGVGKTSTLDTILRILRAKGIQVLLAAPTGRAAKRMTEQTGLEAKTIHRLLEIDPKHGGFSRNEENPLACDLLVIDETSMVDVPLMNALTKAVPEHAALLLVGDVDQLPSVGPGQVLADVIASGAIPVARLTEVFRQAAESRRRSPGAHRLVDRPPPLHDRRPQARASRNPGAAGAPVEPKLLQRGAHLVVAQVEHILPVGQVGVAREQRSELADLVPEDREVAMVDVEVVVLDVREDLARAREAVVEGSAELRRHQGAMLLGDTLALGEQSLPGR